MSRLLVPVCAVGLALLAGCAPAAGPGAEAKAAPAALPVPDAKGAPVPTASGDTVAPDLIGFDWLDPEHAACRPFDAQAVAAFAQCEVPTTGFGEFVPARTCKDGRGGEWMLYATADQCEAELGTMQANGD